MSFLERLFYGRRAVDEARDAEKRLRDATESHEQAGREGDVELARAVTRAEEVCAATRRLSTDPPPRITVRAPSLVDEEELARTAT
jgi:hypothetical protein